MKQFLLFIFVIVSCAATAQANCPFTKDTLTLPKENKTLNGDKLEATFKEKSVVQLFKADNGKYYMKLMVNQNLYFDKVDVLEIRSGSKSFYAKDTKQYQLDKHTGYFVVELYKNYIATLKEDGMTSIFFNKAETDFTKQDCAQVKQLARCFYDVIAAKKQP
jgi:hypothetical protein